MWRSNYTYLKSSFFSLSSKGASYNDIWSKCTRLFTKHMTNLILTIKRMKHQRSHPRRQIFITVHSEHMEICRCRRAHEMKIKTKFGMGWDYSNNQTLVTILMNNFPTQLSGIAEWAVKKLKATGNKLPGREEVASREQRKKKKQNPTHRNIYWFSIMSHSTIPFCLRTDRSVWMKCVHCSTFPLCIQSNMSPPLTEHTGIGCMMLMMTGAQTQRALDPIFPG